MGYDVSLTLETDNPNLGTEEVGRWMARREAIRGDDLENEALGWQDMLEGGSGRWPNWTSDMLALSAEYPEILITMECSCGELGEHHVTFFRDGLCYTARMVRPPFQPERLTKPPEALLP